MDKYKRCIECDGTGHFKCRDENQSQLVKLSFVVENDIDEFITAKGDGFAQGEITRRKRDLKKKMKKGRKVRRLENSNLVVPDSDQDSSSEASLSNSDYDESESEELTQSQLYKNMKRKHQSKKQARRETMAQCYNCAGYHEAEECPRKRQSQYESMRNRFAATQARYKDFMGDRKHRDYNSRKDNRNQSWQVKLLGKRPNTAKMEYGRQHDFENGESAHKRFKKEDKFTEQKFSKPLREVIQVKKHDTP